MNLLTTLGFRYKYFDNNPNNQNTKNPKKRPDCSIRATCIAIGEKDWRKVYRKACDIGEIIGEMPNHGSIHFFILSENGYVTYQISRKKSEDLPIFTSVGDFLIRNQFTDAVFGINGHMFTVKNRTIYDNLTNINQIDKYIGEPILTLSIKKDSIGHVFHGYDLSKYHIKEFNPETFQFDKEFL